MAQRKAGARQTRTPLSALVLQGDGEWAGHLVLRLYRRWNYDVPRSDHRRPPSRAHGDTRTVVLDRTSQLPLGLVALEGTSGGAGQEPVVPRASRLGEARRPTQPYASPHATRLGVALPLA